MTRFDIPAPVGHLLQVALSTGLVDLAELYCLAIEHGSNWRGMADDLCEAAYVGRHDEAGRNRHAAIVKATEPLYTFWRAHCEM